MTRGNDVRALLEREAHGKNSIVIVAVELGRCDLEAAANRQADPLRYFETSEHKSRRDVVERLAGSSSPRGIAKCC
jgi:hypothetical protein